MNNHILRQKSIAHHLTNGIISIADDFGGLNVLASPGFKFPLLQPENITPGLAHFLYLQQF